MPIDFSADAKLILVRNRAGVTQPFSTGFLANSLLVTGIETQVAYAVATVVASELQAEPGTEFDSAELADRAAAALSAQVSCEAAERYRAWRKAVQSGRPMVICLSGAVGVGKSTFASRLALRLGVQRVVSTDVVREVLRGVIPPAVLPELHLAAHEAVSGKNPACSASSPFVRQARAVSGAAASVAERMALEGRGVMVEGAHLLPGEVRDQLAERGSEALVVELLLTLEDERVHRAYMLRRTRSDPARPGVRHIQNFAAIRALQEDLRSIARDAGVAAYDVADLDGLTESIVDRIVAVTDEDAAVENSASENAADGAVEPAR